MSDDKSDFNVTSAPPANDQDVSSSPEEHAGHGEVYSHLKEQVLAETHKLVEQYKAAPDSRRFLVTFMGLFGAVLILASVWLGVHAVLAKLSNQKNIAANLPNSFPGLDATLNLNNVEINAALQNIIDEGDSPYQLMHKGVPEEQDLAQALKSQFQGVNWEMHLPELRYYVARSPWQLGFLEIKSEIPLLTRFDEKRKTICKLLDNPNLDMQLKYTADSQGFTLDASYRDYLWAYVHFEEYEIARALTGMSYDGIQKTEVPPESQNPEMSAAVDTLCAIFRIAEIASRQKELNLRFDAAHIRENAFDTLRTLIANPMFHIQDALKVFQLLENQLADWPSDGLVFRGERTSGVWIYEQTRRRNLINVIAKKDVEALQKLGTLTSVEKTILQNVDYDELYYLYRMSDVILVCEEPYFSRFNQLIHWEDDLESLRGNLDTYPMLAGAVLLRDVRTISYQLAMDRARTEAWVFALASSMGMSTKTVSVNPITGQLYRVRFAATPLAAQKSNVSLQWLESEPVIVIPGYSISAIE